jgi:hypothetical protein
MYRLRRTRRADPCRLSLPTLSPSRWERARNSVAIGVRHANVQRRGAYPVFGRASAVPRAFASPSLAPCLVEFLELEPGHLVRIERSAMRWGPLGFCQQVKPLGCHPECGPMGKSERTWESPEEQTLRAGWRGDAGTITPRDYTAWADNAGIPEERIRKFHSNTTNLLDRKCSIRRLRHIERGHRGDGNRSVRGPSTRGRSARWYAYHVICRRASRERCGTGPRSLLMPTHRCCRPKQNCIDPLSTAGALTGS